MIFIDISLITLIVVGLIMIVKGLRKKSQIKTFIGGTLFLAPIFFFFNLIPFFPFVPVISLIISFGAKKKSRSTIS